MIRKKERKKDKISKRNLSEAKRVITITIAYKGREGGGEFKTEKNKKRSSRRRNLELSACVLDSSSTGNNQLRAHFRALVKC